MERWQGRVRGNRFRPACRAGIAVAAATVACLAFAAPAAAVSFTDPALEFDVDGSPGSVAPLSVATGDFNEDANPDVVTANNAGSVSLMLGNGGGGFGLASGWPMGTAGTNPQSIVVADFNGDDHLDAAASNRSSNNVSVFLGDGDGGVLPAGGGVPASPSTYAVGADGPFYIDKGDFNDDDIVDLVTANQVSNNVSLLIGAGDGTFSPASGSPFAVGDRPRGLAVGDVNDDGDDDVVSADFTDPRGAIGTVTVLLGNGAGDLAAAGPAIPVGQNPRWVTLGDFDEDGDPDIAAANAFTNTDNGCPCADNVTILLGAGDGTFAEADDSPYSTGADTGPFAIGTADLDGDGHLDLATANRFGAVTDEPFFDIADVDLDPSFTDNCELGGGSTNTTTPPADLFVGGAPYAWMLKAGSPAIDTGQPGAVPAGLAIRDVIGKRRRAAGAAATCPDGIRDKGAYEYVGPPCNVSPPTILDGASPVPGTNLSSIRGEWTNAPATFLRRWLRCDEFGDDCTEATPYRIRKDFRVRRPDIGHTFRIQIIASNAVGDSEPALSDPTGVVAPPG